MLLQKELREIDRDKTSGVTVNIKGNNLQRLTGFVEGTPSCCSPELVLPDLCYAGFGLCGHTYF